MRIRLLEDMLLILASNLGVYRGNETEWIWREPFGAVSRFYEEIFILDIRIPI